ncbi:MAG: hypothetical protein R2818_12615 [Flavobacteriales bacterium]
METPDLITLRTALLITLSILLVLVLLRRFRKQVLATDVPAPAHAELRALTVAYHPTRLELFLNVPLDQTIGTGVLDGQHRVIHQWNDRALKSGLHQLDLDLPLLEDGNYFLEMTTSTQRTMRQFRLQQG